MKYLHDYNYDQYVTAYRLLDLWNSIDLEYLKRTELKYLPKDFWLLLHAIVHNTSTNICPVIDQYLAVSTDGTIYACHTINGIKECKLGSIDGYNVYNYPELYKPFDHPCVCQRPGTTDSGRAVARTGYA